MSDLTSFTGESVKGLGGGAHLVTVLPSAILILSGVALFSSRLYPWADPLIDEKGMPVKAGVDSVIFSLNQAGTAGAAVLVLAVLAGAVLLRPFQIAVVQFLEGYWRGGRLTQLAVGRHMSRRRMAEIRSRARTVGAQGPSAAAVRAAARRERQVDALRWRASLRLARYPANGAQIMPTELGNILRAAETHAGERYGFSTVLIFPRLYPFLSPQLDAEYREQTNLLDSSAAFTLLFGILTMVTAPLAWRLDGWSLLPLVTAAVATLSYRGACKAAMNIGQQQSAAFDLHRFDMLAKMRQELPMTGEDEYKANQALTEAIDGSQTQLLRMRYAELPTEAPIRPGSRRIPYIDASTRSRGQRRR